MSEGTRPVHVVGGIAAVVVFIAAFLPWATADAVIISSTKTGIEGDGVITLVLGLVALPCIVYAHWRSWVWLLPAIMGVAIAAIGIYDWAELTGLSSDVATVSVGAGLVLTVVGGLVLTIMALLSKTALGRSGT